ncbi:hypothetical protein H6G89_11155 [Oscillatoria sp. FACHB-1407]|uniref:hypothetical protein n=1 Tax=Oscillatoria sp. FACHB-1407 TaxID=2692847 RepID=UPI0016841EBC|nr:hypothetical protein [Oscillatoria sp. FACHB-1407]MBD2461608.1 hypothetical protein [Oscillatoria sp. FACHB-1407]
MISPQVNLLSNAKKGDAYAINQLINYLLEPKGITSEVKIEGGYLHLILPSREALDLEQLTSYIKTVLKPLNLTRLKGAKIRGGYRNKNQKEFAVWSWELSSLELDWSINDFDDKNLSEEGLQEKLARKMIGLFESVVEERKKYYKNNPSKIPRLKDIQSIISGNANKNSAISGGLNIIPGPIGVAAAIPEILLVIRNQIVMIYDIGIAYGQEKALSKELLVAVFAYALGRGGLGVLIVQGGKVLVKQISARLFPKIVQIVAGRLAQRFVSSMVGKWLPVVGAAAMATWSNIATREIGRKAVELFEKKIEYSSEFLEELDVIEA